MKRNMKKSLALAMVLTLVVSLFAGCGGTPSSSTPSAVSSSTAEPASAQTNADRETVNIRFSQFANSTDDPEGMANDPIKKAIEEKVNITLEYDSGTEGYDDRMQTELAVGNAPDLFPTWGESD